MKYIYLCHAECKPMTNGTFIKQKNQATCKNSTSKNVKKEENIQNNKKKKKDFHQCSLTVL